MSWNKYAAVAYVKNHAHAHSTGYCARAVAKAIEAGGVSIVSADANNFERSLRGAGFREANGQPEPGDVAVIEPIPGHPHGHVCIYDGQDGWYSDFMQHGMYPGGAYRKLKPQFKIYRHY
ncbi:CHAP domain-containing protein [Hafnia alvei]|uniref:CHAP domain-containing protein n=1 Tax=Hafnia alvei TaxID=569 RepID=UPI000C9FACFB|nr:CHAP domain-containing protein [Hafnia alvei]MBI0274334.1 CHAP domain-containing protein [Hafnia alvei]PNK99616.1 CHAP domain-containing protein [Hafnia alvei]